MVEVFKTNISEHCDAQLLLEKIHKRFDYYAANFDLDDCDKILRVESDVQPVKVKDLIKLIKQAGYLAEVLPDVIPL